MAFGMAISGRHGMAQAGKRGMRLGMKEGWVVVFSGEAYFQSSFGAGDVIFVDWGDGTSNTYTGGWFHRHIYADNEEYTVRIYGTATKVWFRGAGTHLKRVLPCDPSKLLRGNSIVDCFFACGDLTSLPDTLFGNTPLLTNADNCFYLCTGLTSIPSGIFGNTPLLTNARNCFYLCTGLTSIPSGIFGNAPVLTNTVNCFRECIEVAGSIPALWTNPNITNYGYCYYYTGKELTEPPSWTHSVDNICAAACAGWTAGLWTGEDYCNC